ncbi:MAG TPA: serine hydrolase domain-containing protein [Bryobacteraceae bacterium]|nr:serine hydrolase domain-containing protein [Bryobacteraceae bacterium]
MKPLAALALVLALGASAEQQTSLKTQIDASAQQWMKEYDVPSFAVGFIENGKLAWTAVYGEQSPGVPASAKTLYNVASLTKPVAAETVLRLVSEGKIQLDEPMAAHWIDPDIAQNPWHKLLTPRLSLSHQTGFTNWRYQTKNVLQFQWEPGTKTGYSGEGYEYVARFAEKKTGKRFEELAQQYVLDPIGMKGTSFTHRPWHEGRVAQPRGEKVKLPAKAPERWSAADLLHTTVEDYSKFVINVMKADGLNAPLAAQRLTMTRDTVQPGDVEKVCAMAKLTGCTATAGMGLGWEILNLNGETIIRHGGSDPGFKSVAFFVPVKRKGVVVFTSGDNGSKIIRRVVEVLHPNPILVAIL